MLDNMLHLLIRSDADELRFKPPGGTKTIDLVKDAWQQAAFSDASDCALKRYFTNQLAGISTMSDTLYEHHACNFAAADQDQLLGLIDHLYDNYHDYLNSKSVVPKAYQSRKVAEMMTLIDSLRAILTSNMLEPSLARCLLNWLDEITSASPSTRFTFGSLSYLSEVISRLKLNCIRSANIEQELIETLSRFNFNHLGFVACRQEMITSQALKADDLYERLNFLQDQKAIIAAGPEPVSQIYDPAYPSLKTMLTDWLLERVRLTEAQLKARFDYRKPEAGAGKTKIPINLSVAQLACLIKVLLEEDVLIAGNTKSVLNFFASHFKTKRQNAVSPGSLSKEYYSTDQQTAARVKDILQKMVCRINRNFFPVVAAASIASLFHPGIG